MAKLIKQRGKEELLQEETEHEEIKAEMNYWKGYAEAFEKAYVIKFLPFKER